MQLVLTHDEEIWWVCQLLVTGQHRSLPTAIVKRIMSQLGYTYPQAQLLLKTAKPVYRSKLLDGSGRDPFKDVFADINLIRDQCAALIRDPSQ